MEDEQTQSEQQIKEPVQYPFGNDLGRLLEIGFNSGLLDGMQWTPNTKTYFDDSYKNDMAHLYAPKLISTLYERTKVISPWDKENLQRWVYYMLIRGYVGGVTFLPEYLKSFSSEIRDVTRKMIYVQCNFYGKNSLDTYNEKNERSAIQELLQQFDRAGHPITFTSDDMNKYRAKGEFLNADTLLLVKYGRNWRILCIDLSVFSVREPADAGDLSDIDFIRSMLARELGYLRSKSVFTRLSIDTDTQATEDIILSQQLTRYFTAFKKRDKESVKVIQAASYAWSFSQFLRQKKVLSEHDRLLINVIGYSDRGWNGFTVQKEQLHLLETCSTIYRQHTSDQKIDEVRDSVLATIERATYRSFRGIAPRTGKDFIRDIMHLPDKGDGIRWTNHEEILDGFVSTLTPVQDTHLNETARQWLQKEGYTGKLLRDVHATLIHKALELSFPYIFLTGSPGIGKTTALVNFLKEANKRGEGFLFIYISPRKHVNLDIIQKFREDTGKDACENIFALTTNTAIIRSNERQKTVHYYSFQRQERFNRLGVAFIPANSDEAIHQTWSGRQLEEIQEGLLIDKGETVRGVLDSLCSGLHATLDGDLSRAIVATVAIQSLKRVGENGGTTLKHLDTIFESVYDSQKKILDDKMRDLRKRIQHIFIMIDEVTGDESGAAFLDGLHRFLVNRKLMNSPYGFNTKVIVADASVVNPKVIKQHLENTNYEPDKIYFRKVHQEEQGTPLSVFETKFRLKPAVVINANAYPADSLRLEYKIGIDTFAYTPEKFTERSKDITGAMNAMIIEQVMTTLITPGSSQLLIYIQDKQRLSRMIQEIYRRTSGNFILYTHYLEIHANVSEDAKDKIAKLRKDVPIVFMTASASRGLSFPRARHVIVDIPHFDIEQNLMEILQVIYRGRGEDKQDCGEKKITFYLTDHIVYESQQDRTLSARESLMHVLNVLLILKTAIMTRIQGYGEIGRKHYMMIPVGGKAVGGAGETFTSKIGNLIKSLQDQEKINWNDKRLEYVRSSLQHILEHVKIKLLRQDVPEWVEVDDKKRPRRPFVPMIPQFFQEFRECVRTGFSGLLNWQCWEDAYVCGSMLIAPIVGRSMYEDYWLQVDELMRKESGAEELLQCIDDLSRDRRYSQNLQMALRDAHTLLKEIKSYQGSRGQHYQQESKHKDQHCAIPIVSFLTYPAILQYFSQKPEYEEKPERSFRTLLLAYIRRFCSAESVLPLAKHYDEFPFLIFRSLSLKEARSKIFTGNYLFMSHEMNILNMMLTASEDENT